MTCDLRKWTLKLKIVFNFTKLAFFTSDFQNRPRLAGVRPLLAFFEIGVVWLVCGPHNEFFRNIMHHMGCNQKIKQEIKQK